MTGEKRNLKKIIFTPVFILLILAMCTVLPGFGSQQVQAADSVSKDIDVKVTYPANGPDESFKIKLEGINGAPVFGETVKTVDNEGSTSFGTFTYTVPGDYKYKITQTKGSKKDVIYDDTEYIVRFFVYYNSNDELQCVTTVTSGSSVSKPGSVTFKNSYKSAPIEPKKVTATLPPIKKALKGDRPDSNRFVFTLTRDDKNSPMPEAAGGKDSISYTIRNVVTEKYVETGKVTFTKEGKYSYTVKEKDLGAEGYDYDKAQYKLVYTVKKNAEGNLVCTVNVLKDSARADVDYIVFTNEYDNGRDSTDIIKVISVDPPVKKVIKGNPTGRTDFNFVMVADDPSYPLPEGSVNGEIVVTINNEGEADFGVYDYLDEGVYTYKIYEKDEGKDGYTYDTIIYTLKDTVTKDERGSLSLSRVVETNTGEVYNEVSYDNFIYEFVNTYGYSSGKKSSNKVNTGDEGANLLRLSILAAGISGTVILIVIFMMRKKRS